MHNMAKDTEDNTFISRSKVHFNIINGVNCKKLVLLNFIYIASNRILLRLL